MIGNMELADRRSLLPSLEELEHFVNCLPIYIASESGKRYLLLTSQAIVKRLGIPWNTPEFIRNARGERFSQMYPERVTEKTNSLSTGNKKSSTLTPKSRVERLKTTLVEIKIG